MIVEDYILLGVCEDCDHDPTDCYNLDYCYYDKLNEERDKCRNAKVPSDMENC